MSHSLPPRRSYYLVVAEAAALLRGQRRFVQELEDPLHGVRDRPHHEAVEQRHRAPGTGTGQDPPGRQEAVTLHRVEEAPGPMCARIRRLGLGQGGGHRSEEHTSELQSLMRISYADFGLTKQTTNRKRRVLNT